MDEHEILNVKYYQDIKLLLKLTGLWPYQKYKTKKFIRIVLLIITYSATVPMISRGIKEIGKNLPIVLECCVMLILIVTCSIRYTATLAAEIKLKYLFEQMTEDWKEFTDKEEQQILHYFAYTGFIWSRIFIVSLIFGFILIATAKTVLPIVLDMIIPMNESRPKILSLYVDYFVDEQEYFNYICLHIMTFGYVIACIFMVSDITFITIVHHSAALFNIAGFQLRRAFEIVNDNKNNKSKLVQNDVHNIVLKSISVHLKSIQFVDDLQDAYSTCYFIMAIACVCSLSILCVLAMMLFGNHLEFIRAVCGILITVYNLVYICYSTQKIINASSYMFYSTYFCGWYAFPFKTKRLIHIMMMRSMRPCILKVGSMLDMSMVSAGMFVKMAMSYFTAMKSMT